MLKRILFFLFSLTSILIVIVLFLKTSQDNLSSSLTQRQVSAQANECTATDTANWCQVQHDPQRTGYYPGDLGTNVKNLWTYPFEPEKLVHQVQAMIYQGKVIIGTATGNLYAIDAVNPDPISTTNPPKGKLLWKKSVGGPIVSSVAVGNNRIYLGDMKGAVYAFDPNGNQIWKKVISRRGLSASPLLADNKILIGGRDGYFYALDLNGNIVWTYQVNKPILQTAAYNNGRVFFGAMDMYVYALNTSDGTLSWKSQKINAMAFKDYWPVIFQGKIYIRPTGIGSLTPADLTDAAQDSLLASYDANPNLYQKSLYVLNEVDGKEAPAVIHSDYETTNGAATLPCIDFTTNSIVLNNPLTYGAWLGYWTRLNPLTRKITEAFNDGSDQANGPRDETSNVACTHNGIIALLQEEATSHSGVYNYTTQKWSAIQKGWILGISHGWLGSGTAGGGGNAASVANGIFYHNSMHELIARSTN